MAYLARIETENSWPVAVTAKPRLVARAPDFSDLEWSVIRLARADRLSTLRPAGAVRRFLNWLTGTETDPTLASPRLEALRRMAVLSWNHGFVVPGDEVAEFLAAGFSPEQYELMVSSIRAAIASSTQRNGR